MSYQRSDGKMLPQTMRRIRYRLRTWLLAVVAVALGLLVVCTVLMYEGRWWEFPLPRGREAVVHSADRREVAAKTETGQDSSLARGQRVVVLRDDPYGDEVIDTDARWVTVTAREGRFRGQRIRIRRYNLDPSR